MTIRNLFAKLSLSPSLWRGLGGGFSPSLRATGIALLFLFGTSGLMAQSTDPFGDFDESDYFADMRVVAQVVMDGNVISGDAVLAVYSGNQLRGKAKPDPKNTEVFYLSIYSDDEDKLIFKVYTGGQIYVVDQGLNFESNGTVGMDAPYVITLRNPVLPGDANGDGTVDAADPVAVANYIIGQPPATFVKTAADVNNDGNIDMGDAVLIMQALANPNKYGIDGTAEHHLTEQGKLNGDMNGDGIPDYQQDYDGDGTPERYQGNWGSYVMAPLAVVNNADKHNRVMRETSANELIFENGRVTGVKAKMADGTQVTAHAKKGVIIATGGYAANIQKVLKTNKYWSRQYLSPNIGTTNRSSLRGDGIDMAQKIGAATVGEGYTQLMPLAYIADGAIAFGGVENVVFISTKDGKRYVDECSERDVLSLNGFKHGIELEGRRGVYFYVMGGGGFGGFGGGFGGFGGGGGHSFNGKDWSGKASALPELFDELGIKLDADVVKNSIREYDMAVMDGVEPAPIGKRHATGIIGSARRGADGKYDKSTYNIDDANLTIRVLAPSTHHTMGGLKIDLDRRVLDENGKAIPGLYAAGEVTGGFFGGNRLGGNALTECMASGRIAAKGIEKDNK